MRRISRVGRARDFRRRGQSMTLWVDERQVTECGPFLAKCLRRNAQSRPWSAPGKKNPAPGDAGSEETALGAGGLPCCLEVRRAGPVDGPGRLDDDGEVGIRGEW